MNRELKPRTSEAHGRLWGARARDWADFQEGTVRPVFQAVLERARVGAGTRYLDAGCASGRRREGHGGVDAGWTCGGVFWGDRGGVYADVRALARAGGGLSPSRSRATA